MPAAAVLAPTATVAHVCTEISCQQAKSHVDTCECSCGGVEHGLVHRAGREAIIARQHSRYVVPGFDRNMLAEIDDEAW